MGRDRKQDRRNGKTRNTRPPAAPQSSRTKFIIQGTLIVVLLALIGSTAWVSMRSTKPTVTTGNVGPSASVIPAANTTPLHTDFAVEPKTLNELLDLPVEQLDQVDIARMNLLCATGLPGAEKLNIEQALATLDRWAERVRFETDRHLYRVNDPRYAEHYRHSEAYLRAEFLLQTLQQDLGVKYDMTAADNFAFNDSRVAFLHGMIPAEGQSTSDTSGGTCASMPVMYVAVGRRLGYPLKLVTTKSHVFARWDGENHPNPAWRERFNIEGAGAGFSSYPDEHYTQGRFAMSDHEVRANRYLLSLSPADELAEFLAARGHCGFDNRQFGFAARCYENAYRYDTTRPAYRSWFVDAAMRSNYRPATPALAQLVQQRRQIAAAMASGPMLDGMPRPSQTRTSLDPHMPVAPRVGGWQPPQPMTPGVPQPVAPDMQPFNHNPQHEPFRSQP